MGLLKHFTPSDTKNDGGEEGDAEEDLEDKVGFILDDTFCS